jgi:hypothetical protein
MLKRTKLTTWIVGHTATLYQGDKLLVFGGENEHRTYLSDLIIFDLQTANWTQPPVTGPLPKGRARHAAVLHEDKLFIIGGITGHDNYVLDDICYLDLKTYTWSRSWRFVPRFDHSAYIWYVPPYTDNLLMLIIIGPTESGSSGVSVATWTRLANYGGWILRVALLSIHHPTSAQPQIDMQS